MSEIGAEILRRRKAHGWSRKDLMVECRRTGGDLSYSEIVRIEQGKVQPRTRTIVQIAAALGVQPYELLPVNGSKPTHAPRPVPGLVPVVKLLQVLARLGGFAGRRAARRSAEGLDEAAPVCEQLGSPSMISTALGKLRRR
jgi:hypothetical protein